MFNSIIKFSLDNKLLVLISVLALILMGVYSASKIPLDAVPDITNNQVQIISTASTLAPQEVEQLITYPLEASMTNIPDVEEVRSISRYGLSIITVVFKEDVSVMLARQYVQEQLNAAIPELPKGLTSPELMPVTTGLGEIYQYVLTVDKQFKHQYNTTKLRTIQDWIVKRQLNGTKGIIEISSFGGYLKQYDIALIPDALKKNGLTITDVLQAIQLNNENSGGSYIEKGPYSFYIRTEGRINTIEEINAILIKNKEGTPIKVRDIAKVQIGSPKRYGAMTMDGKGEVVGGITLMLKGANTSEVLKNVKERITEIQRTLPEGVSIYPYLDRSKLIAKTIGTVQTNLIEGGLIVIFILLLLLGNFRAGMIVASTIPLSLLFALIMMHYWGISANLMSLGAIDFGIVIDGAVIVVEGLLHTLTIGYIGKQLSQKEMDIVIQKSTAKIYKSAAFGVLIILIVFIPILTLEGIEGKTFRPMAQTVSFALLGSMLLSITYVPVMASIFLSKKVATKKGWADQLVNALKKVYQPILGWSLNAPLVVIAFAVLTFVGSVLLFNRLGAEFIPTLEEGDIAMQQSIKPGSSLNESIHTSTRAEKILLDNFPEVEHVVSKIGTAEIPTDPMAIEDADIMIILKDKEEWTSASSREELMEKMKAKLVPISWASFEFTQPIQLRFNELMTGAKSDISIKIFGEDVGLLKTKADEVATIIEGIEGASDIKVDQTDGLQQLSVQYDRKKLAQYGVNVSTVNQIIRSAYAGEIVGNIFEEERKFDLVVRIAPEYRQELDLTQLTIHTNNGRQIPLHEIATIEQIEGPMLISREQARRFINIGVNVRNTDVANLVQTIQKELGEQLQLPVGYELQYGGQFENLEHASNRLLFVVPITLLLILLLLYLAFGSVVEALIIFMGVPMSAIGGIWALWWRDMPFSISSGIGFIALFGVSVLNGIVLLSAIKELKPSSFNSFKDLITSACLARLRPVLMTALVAALGFLPMAISLGNGAEVQRPLATVVIGGLLTSTLLTLVVLPTLYYLFFKKKWSQNILVAFILFGSIQGNVFAQELQSFEDIYTYTVQHHPLLKRAALAKESESLNKKAFNIWMPTAVDYQGGQINYFGFDHILSINQDISPFFRAKERKKNIAIVDRKIDLLEVKEKILLQELKFDLQLAFNDWQYWDSKRALYDSIYQLYKQLDYRIQVQYEVGDLDIVNFELFNHEKYTIEQQKNEFDQKVKIAVEKIRELSFMDDSIQLKTSAFELLSNDTLGVDLDNNLYLSVFQKRKLIIDKQIELEKIAAKQLSWNIGYFAQSLENNLLYQGVYVGIQIPIDRRKSSVKVQQYALEKLQIDKENEAELKRYIYKTKVLQSNLGYLAEAIANYKKNSLPRQIILLEKARQQYEKGELDFLPFSQIQKKLFEEQNSYIDKIKRFNEQLLQLTYLTQPK